MVVRRIEKKSNIEVMPVSVKVAALTIAKCIHGTPRPTPKEVSMVTLELENGNRMSCKRFVYVPDSDDWSAPISI